MLTWVIIFLKNKNQNFKYSAGKSPTNACMFTHTLMTVVEATVKYKK